MTSLAPVTCDPYKNTYDTFLGTTLQPDTLVDLCQDPAMADYALMTSSLSGAAGTAPPQNMDTAYGVSGRSMQPLYAPETTEAQMAMATELLPTNLLEASIAQNTFGQGYVSTYLSDKPVQGIQLLREYIPPPVVDACLQNCFQVPVAGPYNASIFDNSIGTDPRYVPPSYDTASGTWKLPSVAYNGPLTAIGASAIGDKPQALLAP